MVFYHSAAIEDIGTKGQRINLSVPLSLRPYLRKNEIFDLLMSRVSWTRVVFVPVVFF